MNVGKIIRSWRRWFLLCWIVGFILALLEAPVDLLRKRMKGKGEMKISTSLVQECFGLKFKPKKARLVIAYNDSENPLLRVEWREGKSQVFRGVDLKGILLFIMAHRRDWGSSWIG